jgi:hypothetical protein
MMAVDQLPAMRLEAVERALLVRPHQTRIAHHISGEDRGETAGGDRGGHCSDGNNSRAEFNLFSAGKRQFHPEWLCTLELQDI